MTRKMRAGLTLFAAAAMAGGCGGGDSADAGSADAGSSEAT